MICIAPPPDLRGQLVMIKEYKMELFFFKTILSHIVNDLNAKYVEINQKIFKPKFIGSSSNKKLNHHCY